MSEIQIYRIIHISNLGHIVNVGKLVCPNHTDGDPNYKPIGNNSIITSRSAKALPLNNDRTFKDYVAFYFGPRSIMLYNIKTGYGDVNQIDQKEIIYLQSNVNAINNAGLSYFFTDGHGLQYPVTTFFTGLGNIGNVNLKDAYATDFSATAQAKNPDLKRRKQAEFHVYSEVDWNLITEIIVYDEEVKTTVEKILQQNNSTKTVTINKAYYF